MNYIFKTVLFSFLTLSLLACSKANDKAINIDPVTGKHPRGWAAAGNGGLHPEKYHSGPSACYECHGKNLAGGISSVSCFTAARSGINCHPDGPLTGHTEGWSSPNAHGVSAKAMAAGQDGIARCQRCHGSDFAGGSSKKSCLNSAGCHGAGNMAPHSPKPWLSRIGGRTHTTADASNAAGCAVCHTNGANSSRKPSVAQPTGTAPGCFNNTLCHGVEGHVAGWKAASAHGAAAKSESGGDNGFSACVKCHGNNYGGGIAEQSCLNTAGCHGANVAAPHPGKPWKSTTGGASHVSTETSNAGQCAVCHTGGANSTRAPRTGDAIGLTGCFNNTLCHGVIGHPAGWKAANQHGAEAKKAPTETTGFSSCQPCHGAGFINGAAPTCFNSAVCHGSGVNAPHAGKPWFSRVGGSTHTSTDTANVGTCAICHTVGANSSVKPPAPATMTLAGCFNNTLCHFHQIPFAPSASIPASLHGGEAKKNLTVCQACHGNPGSTKFDGVALADGAKTIACSSCHAFAKAHPTDWQGSGAYSHRTAGNRADACTLCHDVTQGRARPLAAAPSCFAASFTNGINQVRGCHPGGPGALPHGVPYNNHNATARSNFSYCLGCHQIAVNASKPPGCRNCHLLDPVANPNNCISCHSSPPNGTAYPNIARSHASHAVMNVANICAECHSGLGLGTVDHLNRAKARTADVQANPTVFGTLTKTGGLSPSYNSATRACSNTYCHGASLVGGSNKVPQWGQTGYLQGCGTCHGFPPAISAHSGVTSATPCAGCHTHVNPSNTGFTDPTKHVNGIIDVTAGAAPHAVPYPNHTLTAACLGCHQDAVTAAAFKPPGCQICHLTSPVTTPSGCTSCHAAPPSGTNYPNIARSHTPHASSSKVSVSAMPCSDCHNGLGLGTVDHQIRSKTRTATGRANPVVFGSGALLVAGGGTASSFNDATGQCANVYCHGAKMSGGDTTGANRAPVWGTTILPANLTAAACGVCHGFPPSSASGHPAVAIPGGFPGTATIGATCSCHANINSAGNSYANIFVDKSKHINGLLEVTSGSAHVFAYGGSAHKPSGTGTLLANTKAPYTNCSGCHDTTTAGGTYPVGSGVLPLCSACHLNMTNFLGASPGCWDCHGSAAANGRPNGSNFPNRQGQHRNGNDKHSNLGCTSCHPFTAGDSRHGWANRQKSISAQINSTIGWNASAKTCNNSCHGTESWY